MKIKPITPIKPDRSHRFLGKSYIVLHCKCYYCLVKQNKWEDED